MRSRTASGHGRRKPALPPQRRGGWLACLLATAAAAWLPPPATAATDKLRLTGGVSSIDGAAGGGLTPWAVTGSLASAGQWGATAFHTTVVTQDHRLQQAGAALAWNETLELSLAHQDFHTGAVGTALGLPGLRLRQDILGLKWRVAGDAVLDSDRAMPAVALGLLARRVDAGGLAPTLAALGARRSDLEAYVSATKLLLAQGVLLNGTLRATRANQNGLLGFGGSGKTAHRLMPEISLAWLLRRDLAIGAEWRRKPDNLNPSLLGAGLREDNWADLFLAWAPSKHLSITAAWVDLGRIVPAVHPRRQTGAYLSLQVAL
jgi:hypothetical protein